MAEWRKTHPTPPQRRTMTWVEPGEKSPLRPIGEVIKETELADRFERLEGWRKELGIWDE
jgi:hypothetical protein